MHPIQWRAAFELLKPITWFAPMWAFACGAVSSGASPDGRWLVIIAGIVLAGPLVCATSQAVNDWFDRHVDAVNEPQRPIPSGRLPGRSGLYIAIAWTVLSLAIAPLLGPWGFGAAAIGLVLAWAYSAPPLRLKRNGWWGNTAVAVCYEGLPWITGATVLAAGALPDSRSLTLALLYSLGAHGIMTLNDFKSVEGDRQWNIASLPVQTWREPGSKACMHRDGLTSDGCDWAYLLLGTKLLCSSHSGPFISAIFIDAKIVAKPSSARRLVQRNRDKPLCARYAYCSICPPSLANAHR